MSEERIPDRPPKIEALPENGKNKKGLPQYRRGKENHRHPEKQQNFR